MLSIFFLRTCFKSRKVGHFNGLTKVQMYCDSWLCHGQEEKQEEFRGTTALPNRFEQQEMEGDAGIHSC